jgi:hypothetical protein
MAKRILIPVLLLAALAGCVTAEDLRRQDEAQCTSYGFKPGTPDFAACLQRENLARRYPPPGFWGPPPFWGPYWR